MPAVSTLTYVSFGMTVEEILQEKPAVEREDILQALRYAAWATEERIVLLEDADASSGSC